MNPTLLSVFEVDLLVFLSMFLLPSEINLYDQTINAT